MRVPIGFGLGFQLPLVMLFLERIGIFDVATYASQWRVAVIVIFVVSAVITPADPYSLLFLAIPLCLLYFGGLAICRWIGPGRFRRRGRLGRPTPPWRAISVGQRHSGQRPLGAGPPPLPRSPRAGYTTSSFPPKTS